MHKYVVREEKEMHFNMDRIIVELIVITAVKIINDDFDSD